MLRLPGGQSQGTISTAHCARRSTRSPTEPSRKRSHPRLRLDQGRRDPLSSHWHEAQSRELDRRVALQSAPERHAAQRVVADWPAVRVVRVVAMNTDGLPAPREGRRAWPRLYQRCSVPDQKRCGFDFVRSIAQQDLFDGCHRDLPTAYDATVIAVAVWRGRLIATDSLSIALSYSCWRSRDNLDSPLSDECLSCSAAVFWSVLKVHYGRGVASPSAC